MRKTGKFGRYGGFYVPEILIPALEEVESAFLDIARQKAFRSELAALLRDYAGRPTPCTLAANVSERLGATIYLKREDLLHGGAHKTNNCLGQGLLAKKMGKGRLIAETGAGQHGVATAMAGALFGIKTHIYMGATDIERQSPNVKRMKLLGAEVIPVTSGTATLKDAINEALRDWIANVETTYYLFGTVCGPHPFPLMVREFQSVIGREARRQIVRKEGRLPDYVYACVGGGSNAMGIFSAFLGDGEVKLVGVEPGGKGDGVHHGAPLTFGRPGVFHGSLSYLLQDPHGQIEETHSVAAGLDYPGVGPEHSALRDRGRVRYVTVTDEEALEAFETLSLLEGIIPALEPAHALASAFAAAGEHRGSLMLINLSGRGDKDLDSYFAMKR
ncbi:MAG: tryptophan synthase subunit beta [Candidatus Eremiobacteraeota bacterium]|nr:tryptophan synthase subunit beta [Candidatus Eremiobacteraeota bacterium]